MNEHTLSQRNIYTDSIAHKNIFSLPKRIDTFQNQVQVTFSHSIKLFIHVMTFSSQSTCIAYESIDIIRKHPKNTQFFFFFCNNW